MIWTCEPSRIIVVVDGSIGLPSLSRIEYELPTMSSTLATTPLNGLNLTLFAAGEIAKILSIGQSPKLQNKNSLAEYNQLYVSCTSLLTESNIQPRDSKYLP